MCRYLKLSLTLVGLCVLVRGLDVTILADDSAVPDSAAKESENKRPESPELRNAREQFERVQKELLIVRNISNLPPDDRDQNRRSVLSEEDFLLRLGVVNSTQDDKVLVKVGRADVKSVDLLVEATSQTLEDRLALIKSGRIAAHRNIVKFARLMELGGNAEKTFYRSTGLRFESKWPIDTNDAAIQLALVRLEYCNTSEDRLTALYPLVTTTGLKEMETRVRWEEGAGGGEYSNLLPSIAKRLHAEEQLVNELAVHRQLAVPNLRNVHDNTETEQEHPERDGKALEAGAKAARLIANSLRHASPQEFATTLTHLRSRRIAALRGTANFLVESRNNGSETISKNDVLNAYADLAQAEFEYDKSPKTRLAVLKTILTLAADLERSWRVKYKEHAGGGSSLELLTTIAARIKAEETLARHILAQQEQRMR